MGVKFKTTKNNFPSMERGIEILDGLKVNVGVLGGEHAWLAGIHEFGCKIPVTPEMRAYLHYRGIHLKKSTTQIVIPERSFLRAGFDEHHEEVIDMAEKAVIPNVLAGKMTKEQFGKTIGQTLASAIKDYAVALKDPPNSEWTIRDKKSSNPLIASGEMIEHITYEVE